MAKAFPSTPAWAAEASAFTTTVSRAFEAMLAALRGFFEAERDLEQVAGAYDPAYGLWLRDAELAHEGLTRALCTVLEMSSERSEDRVLLRVAERLDDILGTEELDVAHQLTRAMRHAFWARYQLRDAGPMARHHNRLALEGVHLAQAMITLELYAGSVVSEPAPQVAAAA